MKTFFVLLFFVCSVAVGGLSIPKYLEHYGYTPPGSYFHNDISNAIAEFQITFGLNVTGIADRETVQLMETPRCGNSDKEDLSYAYTRKWPRKKLTYYFDNFSNDLYEKDFRELTSKAFKFWSAVSGLSFREKDGGDIIIAFGTKRHGDSRRPRCYSDFDGKGSVLAHAFYPTDGRLHFDDDERFAKSRWWPLIGGTNYLWVATHEIGHVLGLSHDKENKDSVMYPYYRSFNSNMKLSANDISRIRALYG